MSDISIPPIPAVPAPDAPAPGATAARPAAQSHKESHWYTTAGEPCYEVTGKTTGRPRPTNLTDARSRNLLPGVSTILKVLHKEALVNWMIEQAVLAVVTSPRQKDEKDDAFIERVLHVERVHEQERDIARDKGTAIHDEIANYFGGSTTDKAIDPFIMPAITALEEYGEVIAVEGIVTGPGYAGRYDLLQDCKEWYRLWDAKSSKKLPDPRKGAYLEHRLQLAAYAKALKLDGNKPILCGNVYIASTEDKKGEYVICEHEDWEGAYNYGFAPLVTFWQWVNQHFPSQTKAEPPKMGIGAPEAEAIRKAASNYSPVLPEQNLTEVLKDIAIPGVAAIEAKLKGKKVVWSEGK